MPTRLRQLILPLYLLCCLLFGGSTRAPWSNMVLQLGAITILAWAGMSRPRFQAGGPGAQLAVIMAAMFALIIIQLIPLPPAVWSALPGRGVVANGFDLLGEPRPWLPLSLAPYDTLASILWLLPPLAILAGVLHLGAFRETWMTMSVIVSAIIGVILGALQVSSSNGHAGPWYLYSVTNTGAAVGFFANSNHMAILLVATLPFLASMYGSPRGRFSSRQARAMVGKVALLGGATLAVLVGIALSGSLAGAALGAIVFAASAFVRVPLHRLLARWGLAAVGIWSLVAIGVIIANPLENNLKATGAENQSAYWFTTLSNSVRATADHFPIGSGVGSFAIVYPSYEDPAWVDRWYVNHVNNDYVEVALEAGLAGILLMAAFIAWWMHRAIVIWRAYDIDNSARAATVASGAILLHSFVDFPLRTTSISTLFAFCVAIMIATRRRSPIRRVTREAVQSGLHISVG